MLTITIALAKVFFFPYDLILSGERLAYLVGTAKMENAEFADKSGFCTFI